jgi:FixJ family two-component response regulator
MSNATLPSLGTASSARAEARVFSAPDSTAIVYVIDDDASVRQSLEMLIDSAGWQVKAFASAVEFLASPRPAVPSCLVLDVWLPGLSGLELQDRISADRTDIPIIFVTGRGDVPMTVRAMKRGAVEFLTKPFRDDALLDAVGQALERSRAVLAYKGEMQDLRERYASLSVREREVMALVVAGRLNKQVAAELGISVITVKAHRGHLMRKMGAASLPHLVEMAAGLAPGRRALARGVHPRLWDAA